jgi:acetyl-CoA C-acetyltransferase
MSDSVVIVSYARTPLGSFQGALKRVAAPMLGAAAIGVAVERAGIAPERVEKAFMGCVLPAGLGQAPARQAALAAGLARSTEATTVNKMCGSGMQAAIFAHDALAAGSAEVIVAGGMESMSNAPWLVSRTPPRMGHGKLLDSMFLDGLEDAYEPGKLMGAFAEEAATAYQLTRAVQDEYAMRSLQRARDAARSGAFARELVPVADGKDLIADDEQPQKADAARIALLKPAFAPNGTVTAANASSISDGAAALILTRASIAEREGFKPVARIVAHAGHAHEPGHFTTAPVPAMRKAMQAAGWRIEEVDLFEVNEAFAVVPLIAMRELGIPHERMNIHGGACALGHPIGASGARILATLIAALETHRLKRGLAAICIGGGEATAMAIELV